MAEAGMLNGGDVDADMLQTLVNSLRESVSNSDEISTQNNPISSDAEEEDDSSSQYTCPECFEKFNNWDTCLSHFAITSHADYSDDTDKSVLKKQCLQPKNEDDASTTSNTPPAPPSSSSYSSMPAVDQVVTTDSTPQVVEDEENIDDID